MICLTLYVAVLFGFASVRAEHSSLVTSLPGLSDDKLSLLRFNQYSGYLSGLQGERLHYWFVESCNSPQTDPVVLWLGLGPGCSAMDELLSGHGPFRVNDDLTLGLNGYSWNSNASIIYLDSPALVGFSMSSNDNFSYSSSKLVNDNYAALLKFYEEFDEFSENKLFIGGSGYGGVQAIRLAEKIIGNKSVDIPLKGIIVGNPILDGSIFANASIYYAYYHGLIAERLWQSLQGSCCEEGICNFASPNSDACKTAVEEFHTTVYNKGINLYDLKSNCSGGVPPRDTLQLPEVTAAGYTKLTCVNQTAETMYFQQLDVRDALHISADSPQWTPCSASVTKRFEWTTSPASHVISKLVPYIDILIYSGLDDMLYNYLASEWAIESLNLMPSVSSRMWLCDNQVGGFIKEWESVMSVLTVKGAGHFSPRSQPGCMLQVIKSFLQGRPIG
ncbi:lysosomal protective protein-like [Corticium candelabrum]|uniref:lysosomal protective protein-like n=1 Tax=Corticium candelabrum TaxID=121492 RepID=UPI002E258B31|nr:lysosomal protective protein-like [Corticium candelabrum]